jgi:hypothetical protein
LPADVNEQSSQSNDDTSNAGQPFLQQSISNITDITKIVQERLVSAADSYHRLLLDTNRLDAAAWFLSLRFPSSGSWLSSCSGMFLPPTCKLSDQEYLIALRMRLLLPLSLIYEESSICSCGMEINKQSFTHPIDCGQSRGERNIRHNACRDTVMIHYKRQFPDLGCISEPNLVTIDPTLKKRSLKRGDLSIKTILGNEIIIDFAVTNPSASCFLAFPQCSHLRTDVANIHQEKIKRRDYVNVTPSVLNRLLIFSIEATGRIGPRATLFLDKLFLASSSKLCRYKSLLKQIESVVMKFNAKMIYNRFVKSEKLTLPPLKLPLHRHPTIM